jgi:hypothetical protein
LPQLAVYSIIRSTERLRETGSGKSTTGVPGIRIKTGRISNEQDHGARQPGDPSPMGDTNRSFRLAAGTCKPTRHQKRATPETQTGISDMPT